MKEKVLISACLLGVNCKYDGTNNLNDKVNIWKDKYELIPICPEVWGGMMTPRRPSERREDKVFNDEEEDVSKYFYSGATESLELAKRLGVKKAILKSRSPSCGKGIIYDGTFSKVKVAGNGITAELLMKNGIEVFTEDEL